MGRVQNGPEVFLTSTVIFYSFSVHRAYYLPLFCSSLAHTACQTPDASFPYQNYVNYRTTLPNASMTDDFGTDKRELHYSEI
jgi:hypothetical protein